MALVAFLGASLSFLAGCSNSDFDLPTLGGRSTGNPNDLVVIAKNFYDCMTDAGIGMQLIENNQGDLTVVDFNYDQESTIMFRWPGGGGGASFPHEQSDAEIKAQDEFFSSMSTDPALIYNGTDQTEAFAGCLERSGYDYQLAWGPGGGSVDAEYLTRVIEANNTWAACARENGYPAIKDSVMPTDLTNPEWPVIWLPKDITEPALRQLLAACPNFNREAAEELDRFWVENPTATEGPDIPLDPAIQIELPEFLNQPSPDGFTPEQEAELEAYSKISEILYEASNQYFEEKYADQTSGVEVLPDKIPR